MLVSVALPAERQRIRDLLKLIPDDEESKTKELLRALNDLWAVHPREKIVVFTTYLGSVDSLQAAIDNSFPKAGVDVLKVSCGDAVRWPKFGFCALQSSTSFPSTCGNGLLARRGCGVPRMMGAMQSTKRPSPVLAPPCTNPACSQAALISAHARCRGAACTETTAPKPTRNPPRTATQI
jgi:hypothetical protein